MWSNLDLEIITESPIVSNTTSTIPTYWLYINQWCIQGHLDSSILVWVPKLNTHSKEKPIKKQLSNQMFNALVSERS